MYEDTPACAVAQVTFEAGCRNNWHVHPVGQILVVTEGLGLYQEEGQPARFLRPGDVIHIKTGVNHWHGATPEQATSHIAITLKDKNGQMVTWGEPMTGEVFAAAAAITGLTPTTGIASGAPQYLLRGATCVLGESLCGLNRKTPGGTLPAHCQ